MLRLTRTKQCPSCGHQQATRRRRKHWMRLIFSSSVLFRCRKCQDDFLVLSCRQKPHTEHA